ncbi:MAG: hypothetical protein PWQ37_2767 [Candidatus Petromonas sp.]|nr:hypothetical protein [Candidatus Petromonas sp.]
MTKTKSIFPNGEALMKMLYLVTMDVVEKWTDPYPELGHNFGSISRLLRRLSEGVSEVGRFWVYTKLLTDPNEKYIWSLS